MNFESFKILGWAVSLFLITGILLFIGFRILRAILPALPLRTEYKRYLRKYLPALEVASWLIFLIWGIKIFLQNNPLYASGLAVLLLILTVMLALFGLKDVIAGSVFKTNRRFTVGDTITIREHTGRIMAFDNRNLIIESPTGETVHLPYSSITGEIIIKRDTAELISGHAFELSLKDTTDIDQSIRAIQNHILTLPWASVKRKPIVLYLHETDGLTVFAVTVFSTSKSYFYKLESALRKVFEG